ncbi:MAG: 30S ribosomal protein S5 [Metamycoplasmataceae bacterium]
MDKNKDKKDNVELEKNKVQLTQEVEMSDASKVEITVAGTKEVSAAPAKKEKSHFASNSTNFVRKPKGEGTPNSKKRQPMKKRVSEFEEKVIDIARVTTVVKGGRRFSFSAIVIIGNKKGKVGIGHGKAKEVPDSIKKAIKNAQSNMINVPIINKSTIPHEIQTKYLSSNVLLKPAPKGKGIIASGTVRSVVELAGITDIYTKSYGSRTKANTAKATLKALSKLRTIEEIASLRDISVSQILK